MKKSVLLFITVVLSMSLFAGCGASKQTGESASGTSSSESSVQSEQYPSKPLNAIVMGAGGGWDKTMRALKDVIVAKNLSPQPIKILNKAGASGDVAFKYLRDNPDHSVSMCSSLIFTNQLDGITQLSYKEFKPLAILTTEWIVTAVRNESPYKTAIELMDALKKDPSSLKIGVGVGLGTNDNLSFAMVAKAYGVDYKKLNVTAFPKTEDILNAMAQGKIDIIAVTAGDITDATDLRILACTADKRYTGKLSYVPTWKELGIDVVFPHFRGLIGPANMTEQQVAFWDKLLSDAVNSPEWQKVLADKNWIGYYKNSKETAAFMDEKYQMYTNLYKELNIQPAK